MRKLLSLLVVFILLAVNFPNVSYGKADNIAYSNIGNVKIDGKEVSFKMYALKNSDGKLTNYIKLRDLACALTGTRAEFEIEWQRKINIVKNKPYTLNGTEMSLPFSGDRIYSENTNQVFINGENIDIRSIILMDNMGGGYTYFRLRDLAQILDFAVSWSDRDSMIYINTDYTGFYHTAYDSFSDAEAQADDIELAEDGKIKLYRNGEKTGEAGKWSKINGEPVFETGSSRYPWTYDNGIICIKSENENVIYEKTDASNLAGRYISGEKETALILKADGKFFFENTAYKGSWTFDSGIITAFAVNGENSEPSDKIMIKPLNDAVVLFNEYEGNTESCILRKTAFEKFVGKFVANSVKTSPEENEIIFKKGDIYKGEILNGYSMTADIRKDGSYEISDKTGYKKRGIWYISGENEITLSDISDASEKIISFEEDGNTVSMLAQNEEWILKKEEICGIYYTESASLTKGLEVLEGESGKMLDGEMLLPDKIIVSLENNGKASFVSDGKEHKGSWSVLNNLVLISFEDAYSCICKDGGLILSVPSANGKAMYEFRLRKLELENLPVGSYEFSYGIEVLGDAFEQLELSKNGITDEFMKLHVFENGSFEAVFEDEKISGNWQNNEKTPFIINMKSVNGEEFVLYFTNENLVWNRTYHDLHILFYTLIRAE